jgi:hypothetical protein
LLVIKLYIYMLLICKHFCFYHFWNT